MSNIKKILVYGATGDQCRPVAEKLLAAGFSVRVLARDPAKAQSLAEAGAEVVQGDYTDRASLMSATQGVDAVFLFVPFLDPQPEYGYAAIDAAVEAEVQMVVWNATGPIVPVETGNPGLDLRKALFDRLVASGLKHVVLQPTAYLENFLNPAISREVSAQNRFAYPIPNTAFVQWTTHQDVAAFAVAAFQKPEVANVVLSIAGPERLNGEQVAERFGRALNRSISFRPMPPEEFGAHLDDAFGPGAGAGVVGFYSAVFDDPSLFSTDVDLQPALDALPVKLTSVEQWVARYNSAFS